MTTTVLSLPKGAPLSNLIRNNFRKLIWTLVLSITAGLASITSQAQTVTLFNSGFEAGNPAFIYSAATGTNAGNTNSAGFPRTGTYAGFVQGASTNSPISGSVIPGTPINFVAGRIYTIQVYAKYSCATSTLKFVKSATATNAAMVSATGSDIIATGTISTTTYSAYSYAYLATATETKYLGFQVIGGNAGGCFTTVGFDDVTITEYTGQNISSIASGNWSATTTWSTGTIPTAADNVTISTGHTVTEDVTAAEAGTLTVNGTLTYEATTARTLTVTTDVTIASGGTVQSAASGAVTAHSLSVGGSLTNNGTLDFSTAANAAGAQITFTGSGNASFTLGGSSVTDLRNTAGLTLNKGTSTSSVQTFTPGGTFTVQGANTLGFLSITNGMFKIAGTATLSNPVFATANYVIPATGGFTLNDANFTVVAQNSIPAQLSGTLQIDAGTYNIGTDINGRISYTAGAVLTVNGGTLNLNGRLGIFTGGTVTYTQTGGTVNVATFSAPTGPSFQLATGSTVVISGGTIIIRNGSTTQLSFLNDITNTSTITGGTLQLGDASTPASAQTFFVQGNLPSTTVTSTTANHIGKLNGISNVNGNLLINGTFQANTFALGITGNFTNNGTLTPSTQTTTFNGTTQSISGSTVTAFSSITIASGSTVTGTTASTATGTFTINSGGKYIQTAGTTIPGTTAKNFVSGSTYELQTSAPSFSTNAFGNLIINFTGTGNMNAGGSLTSVLNNLYIKNTGTGSFRLASSTSPVVVVGGDLIIDAGTFNITTGAGTPSFTVNGNVLLNGGTFQPMTSGVPTIFVKGNWTNNGATFTPGSTTVTFNGTSAQTIGGTASTAFNGLTVNNAAGLNLGISTTVSGTLTLTNGNITTGAFVLTANGSISNPSSNYVIGNLRMPFATGSNVAKVFTVGNTIYTPITVTFPSVTAAGNVTVSSTAGDQPQISTSCFTSTKTVNNYWSVSNSGTAPASYNVTLNYTAAITDGTATPANFKLGIYNGSTWAYLTPTSSTATALTANGLTTFGDLQVGEATLTAINTQPTSPAAFCAGGNASFTVAATGLGTGYSWEVSTDNGLNFLPVANGGVYSGAGTGTLTITGATAAMNAYQYRAVVSSTCQSSVNSNIATLTVNPLPTAYTVGGGGAYCAGGTGVSVTLSGSENGYTYNLIRGGSTVATLTGTGLALSFANQTVSGTYTVGAISTTTPTCPQTMTGSATVTVNPLQTAYNVTGGGGYCSGGTGVSVNLSGSQAGFTYNLILSGSTVATLTGTGSALAFTNQTATGTYTIEAISTATPACNQTMSGSAVVSINPLPTVYNVTGGGTACNSGSFAIGLDGSESGVNYQLKRGATNVGSPVAGTGSAISFPNQSIAATYTVVATNATTTCTENMSGSAVVAINPLPVVQTLTGGGSQCAGGAGVAVGLASSESGVDYQLLLSGNPVNAPVSGTGSAISFGNVTASGNYNYTSSFTATGCTRSPSATINVTINALPIAYTVTGGGINCAGGSGVSVGLSDSQNGVDYELFLDAVTTGMTVSGTGSAISFGSQTAAGTYTVTATNTTTTCFNSMSGSATVTTVTSTTWTGTVSTAWTNSGNWTNCVPNSGIDALIPNGAPRYPIITTSASVKTITIASSASVTINPSGTLTVYGDFVNGGTFTGRLMQSGTSAERQAGGSVIFNGAGAQSITNGTFFNVSFTGAGPYTSLTDMAVSNQIAMVSGILTITPGFVLQLGTTGSIIESETSYVIGEVQVTRTLTLANEDFGGIGLEIDANGTAPGLTSVVRTTGVILTGDSTSESIERYFTISAATASGLDATVIFHYFQHELNGIPEADLAVFRSPGLGDGFSNQHGTPVAPSDQVILSNVMGFGQNGNPSGLYTLGDGNLNPLPVVLTSFTAERAKQNALIRWSTVSEKENAGFEVAVSTDQHTFRTIGKVNAAAVNGRGQEYSFTDTEAGKSGIRYYRLTQLDLNGTRNSLGIRSVTFDGLSSSLSATPNPTFSSFTASVSLAEAQTVTLTLTDAMGRVVSQRTVELSAGQSQLSYELGNQAAGMYVLSAQLAHTTLNVKVVKQ